MAAESFYSKIFWIIAAACVGMILSGVSGIVYISVQLATLDVRTKAVEVNLAELRVEVSSSTKDRYTGADAAKDRANFMELIAQLNIRVSDLDRQQRLFSEWKASMTGNRPNGQ